MEVNKIYNMDCMEGMKLLDDNSIDSIVTDPPYELGFMGKAWDSTGIAYNVELWKEAMRVLKPGGHLLAFGGTRTYHRMACAIEDAGFEIRDQMQWIYGSGFPKSRDISKAIDKKLGAEREVIGIKKHSTNFNNAINNRTGYLQDEANRNNKKCFGYGEESLTIPATDEAKQWDGWGTALKPANEPICVARKPLSENTIAENVLKWGTGGINIDGCRIEYEESGDAASNPLYRKNNNYKINYGIDSNPSAYALKKEKGTMNINPQGRFPANVILDEEAGKMLDGQSGINTNTRHMSYKRSGGEFIDGIPSQPEKDWFTQETGGASRFFYCAKASKGERGEGNNHPTVKPVDLMEYLIKLVTPAGGVVLDPFIGSGTTAIAAINLGLHYIGFELEKENYDIANQRIERRKRQGLQVSMLGR